MKSGTKRSKQKRGGILAGLLYDMKHNPYLCLLCLPAIIWFCIFAYSPLVYLLTAFKRYQATKGLWGSEWVGLKNFEAFFGSDAFFRVTFNTIFLNALFIVVTMIFSILIAIALSEVGNRLFKKVTQSIVILPHFISWTVIALLCEALLKTQNGFINNILVSLGLEKINFYQNADVWPALLTILRVWQGAGYGSIVYLATIAGLDQEMFEAARVDGATRGQCIRYLTLPLLKSTAIMLFIMNVSPSCFSRYFLSDSLSLKKDPRGTGMLCLAMNALENDLSPSSFSDLVGAPNVLIPRSVRYCTTPVKRGASVPMNTKSML